MLAIPSTWEVEIQDHSPRPAWEKVSETLSQKQTESERIGKDPGCGSSGKALT
jgi:hypothetical protein